MNGCFLGARPRLGGVAPVVLPPVQNQDLFRLRVVQDDVVLALHPIEQTLDCVFVVACLTDHLLHRYFVAAADVGVRVRQEVQVKILVLRRKVVIDL